MSFIGQISFKSYVDDVWFNVVLQTFLAAAIRVEQGGGGRGCFRERQCRLDIYFAVQAVQIIIVEVFIMILLDGALLVVRMIAVDLLLWQFERIVVVVLARQRVHTVIIVVENVNVVFLELL